MKVLVTYQKVDVEYDLSKDQSIDGHVEQLVKQYSAPGGASQYTLYLIESHKYLISHDPSISSGSKFLLKIKPSVEANTTVAKLKSGDKPAAKKLAIFALANQLTDPVFADEFHSIDGACAITDMIQSGIAGNTLAYALKALEQSLSYGVRWESLPEDVLQRVASTLDRPSEVNVCKSALAILSTLTNNSPLGFNAVNEAINVAAVRTNTKPYQNVVNILSSTDLTVQLTGLTLINNMIASAESAELRLEFMDRLNALEFNVPLKKMVRVETDSVKLQVYRYQCALLSRTHEERKVAYDKTNEAHEATLLLLWTTVFPDEELTGRVSEQWKRLGFQGTDPATDFRGMGLLGLKQLLYFAVHYLDVFKGIVMEQCSRDGNDYPVSTAGINISQMVMDIFGVCSFEQAIEKPTVIYPILFDHCNPLEELYCIGFQSLNYEWDKMNASYMDFPAVIAASKKHVTDNLHVDSLDNLKRLALNFDGTATGSVAESDKDEVELSAHDIHIVLDEESAESGPLVNMRRSVREDVMTMVKTQKISLMKEGTHFQQYRTLKKQQFIFLRLNAAETEFQVAFTSSTVTPSEFQRKVNASDCAGVVTGMMCPTFRKEKKKPDEEVVKRSFSLLLKNGESIDLVAQTRDDYVNWADGLRVFLGSGKVEIKENVDDIKALVDAEVTVRLLDLEGSRVPKRAPPVPPPPADFEFAGEPLA
eukprot:TRINITY_DN348_c0_g1_i1.p1 TRINITY_DN348_c0_g1~~TRINITY_DN348_c0_g1_i1.p1  ORF type:complete len:706 (+),score=182.78 TRINITY_DN348_c0_g1_i1:325-2442(+)